MEIELVQMNTARRIDDGMTVDYAAMIRMWSAFHRSISSFNRKCGVVNGKSETSAKGKTAKRGKSGR